jgi:hypothetical protein
MQSGGNGAGQQKQQGNEWFGTANCVHNGCSEFED